MAYIRERNGRFAITLKIGQHLGGKSKTKTLSTKKEAIIWEQEHRLALKRGDPTLNLTKDKFADIATAQLAQVTPVYSGGAFFPRSTICQFIIR